MNVTRIFAGLAGGVLALAGFAGSASAVTYEFNGDGSSAARQMIGYAPVEMCDAYNSVTNPIKHYKSSAAVTSNDHVWTCTVNAGADNIIFRYKATGSADGFNDVQTGASKPLMDEVLSSGCGAPVHKTVGVEEWDEVVCTTLVNTNRTVNFGGSDTRRDSFGQSGPVNSGCPATIVPPILGGAPCTAPVPVAPGVTDFGGPVVPFAVVVGNGVQKWDPATNTVIGKAGSLSRDQIERIFTKEVTDWHQIGLATALPCTAAGVPYAGCTGIGIAPSGTAATFAAAVADPIDLCERSAGSGSKAGFNRTLMILSSETGVASGAFTAGADTAFGKSSGDVLTCLTNNPNGIGYQDADAVPEFPTVNPNPRAYPVKINGFAVSEPSYDPGPVSPAAGSVTVDNRKLNIRCGQYPFWVQFRATRPSAGFGNATMDTAFAAFVSALQGTTLVNALKGDPFTAGDPLAGHFWVAAAQMVVSKNSDRGPMLFPAGAHSECSVAH